MVNEQQLELDREKVKDTLALLTLPREFERLDTSFDEDWTGDPAVRLTFTIRDDVRLESKDIARLNKFLFEVTSALLREGIAFFPYPRMVQAA